MVVLIQWRPVISNLQGTRDPFVESPDNFSGKESYFVRAIKTQILLVLKAEL